MPYTFFQYTEADLQGFATDPDSQPVSPLTYRWEQLSGPGVMTFEQPTSLQTRVHATRKGTYLVRLYAYDGATESHDDTAVTILFNPPLPATPPISGLPSSTRVLMYVDESGSMAAEYPSLRAMFLIMRDILQSELYGGDAALAEQNVLYLGVSDERWLRWIAEPDNYSIGENDNLIILSFINESSFIYHSGEEGQTSPKTGYIEDWQAYNTNFPQRDNIFARVYDVNSLGPFDFDAFKTHLVNAMGALQGYAPYPLAESITYSLDIASGSPANVYTDEILTYLELPQYTGGAYRYVIGSPVSQNISDGSPLIGGPFILTDAIEQSDTADGTVSYSGQLITPTPITQNQVDGEPTGSGQYIAADDISHNQNDGNHTFTAQLILPQLTTMNHTDGNVIFDAQVIIPNVLLHNQTDGSPSYTGQLIIPNSHVSQNATDGTPTLDAQYIINSNITQNSADGTALAA